jgi:hypothetical protein
MRRRLLILLAGASLAAGLLVPAAAAKDQVRHTAGVVPPQARVHGLTYGEWAGKWWAWSFAVPIPDNPGLDPTGEKCGVAQTGDVWFLAFADSNQTDRTCRVPPGTFLFAIVVANECSTLEPPPFFGSNEAELRACASAGFEDVFGEAAGATYSVTIDGRSVKDLPGYRSISPLFSITLPDDNIYGLPPGTGDSVSDGVFVMLEPLSVGTHRLEMHFDLPAFGGPSDENYTLIVD